MKALLRTMAVAAFVLSASLGAQAQPGMQAPVALPSQPGALPSGQLLTDDEFEDLRAAQEAGRLRKVGQLVPGRDFDVTFPGHQSSSSNPWDLGNPREPNGSPQETAAGLEEHAERERGRDAGPGAASDDDGGGGAVIIHFAPTLMEHKPQPDKELPFAVGANGTSTAHDVIFDRENRPAYRFQYDDRFRPTGVEPLGGDPHPETDSSGVTVEWEPKDEEPVYEESGPKPDELPAEEGYGGRGGLWTRETGPSSGEGRRRPGPTLDGEDPREDNSSAEVPSSLPDDQPVVNPSEGATQHDALAPLTRERNPARDRSNPGPAAP